MATPSLGSTSTSTSEPTAEYDSDAMTVGSNLEKADTKRTQNPSNRISRYSSLIRRPTTGQNFDHPFAHVQTSPDNIVGFDGEDDPYNPKNWPLKKKMATTALYGLATMGSTWASSVYASGAQQISDEFHVGRPVSQLGKTLFLVGYGLGAMIWAPVSEVFGRITATLPPYLIAAIFSFGTATAKDIQTVIITRFFTGFFSAGPMANNGGVLADIWTPANRAKAMVGYSLAVAAGPSLGPIAGGAIIQGGLRWRWTEYVTGSFMMLLWTLDVLILDESYAPRLLVYKARRLRLQTGNWALHAQFEEWDVSVKELALKFGMRPLQMLCTPICFLFALYASFCYGILYANLSSFPILFQEERGWNHAVGALPFLAVFIGLLVGGVINVTNQGYYMKRLRANNGKPVPEARLPPMMIGSVVFACGLFLFGWTSSKDILWVGPCFGAIFIGFGFFTIFQACSNYLVDTFQHTAASTVAANSASRSLFAAPFPLFVAPMFSTMGIHWASSVFAFFATLMIPIPYLFYVFGERIRIKGRFMADLK